MDISSSVRINVYLTQNTHRRLKAYCKSKGQTIQGGITVLVEAAVAEVKDIPPPKLPARPDPLFDYAPEPTDWNEEFCNYADGGWLPDAIEQVLQGRRAQGLRTPWVPPKLTEFWIEGYRARCQAAGRDAEADLVVYEDERRRV